MRIILKALAVGAVFALASLGWLVLGGVTASRTETQSGSLGHQVAGLWGEPQEQAPPQLTFTWETEREETRQERQGDEVTEVRETVTETHQKQAALNSTNIAVDLKSTPRRKGLVWYSLYDVSFDGTWTYEHRETQAGQLVIAFRFPDASGIYDDFSFVVDGREYASSVTPTDGAVQVEVPVEPDQSLQLAVRYRSRGMDRWVYRPSGGAGLLKDFRLQMATDFADIDFPAASMSPSTKSRSENGWTLAWEFEHVVTGHSIGMLTPSRIQPGELAAALSFSAPVSLLFFFAVLFMLSVLRKIDIHPVNYLFLAAAFFAFHLLFAYSVDHLAVPVAFAMCSVVSLVLVVSYLRLVVSSQFAFREAAAAQLLYLVGFSLAHFWEGFTGLTVTVLATVTLFVLMQATGRIRWSELGAAVHDSAAQPRR